MFDAEALQHWQKIGETMKDCPQALADGKLPWIPVVALDALSWPEKVGSAFEQQKQDLLRTCTRLLEASEYRWFTEDSGRPSSLFRQAAMLVSAAVTEWTIFSIVRFSAIDEIASMFAGVPMEQVAMDRLLSFMGEHDLLLQMGPMRRALSLPL